MTMTPRERFMKALRGERPDVVPNYNTDTCFIDPMIMQSAMGQMFAAMDPETGELPEGWKAVDCFGITWLPDPMAPMVDVSNPAVTDIEDWRDQLRIPDYEHYDWEAAIPTDSMFIEDDKASQIFMLGPFMTFVNALGYEEAFVSLYTEQEESKAMLGAITDFLTAVVTNTCKNMRVDSFVLHNDMANPQNMMIDPKVYRSVIKPFDKQIFDAVAKTSPDTVLEYHCCGWCEPVIGDFIDLGCTAWQPAQPMNDLSAIKEKYGDKIVFDGAWDTIKYFTDPDVTEEQVRQSIRDLIDEETAGGRPFVFWDGGPYGADPHLNKICEWAADEVEKYGATAYSKQGY
jgi:hypothetical protein